MQRRDMLKSLALASTSGLALGAATGAFASQPSSSKDSTEAARAMADFLNTVADIDAGFSDPQWRLFTPDQFAEARVMLSHAVNHAMDVWGTIEYPL